MASLYNADLKPLAPDVPVHPYDHATKLFIADNFRLAPKQSFLYYVCINVDSDILQNIINGIVSLGNAAEPVSSETLIEQYEAGLMAKRVDLPKFTMNTKTLNAYNRKNIIQTHISYEPISIVFHDDAADVVTRFWNDYYTYYYRDSDYQFGTYLAKHKYQPRLREKWGYSPRNGNLKSFLRNIQIYSLHNKRFTEYTLINPFISSWRHGEHNSYTDIATLENAMTISYEAVKYRTGYVNAVDVNGFALLHYDNVQSPISTSTTNIYTQGGLIGAVAGGPTDLSRPDGYGAGNGIFSQIIGAYQFYNNIKNANLGALAKQALPQLGLGVLNKAVNYGVNAIFPTLGGYTGAGTATSAVSGQTAYGVNPYAYGATASLGQGIIAAATGAAVNTSVGTLNQYAANWTRGIQSNFAGPGVNPGATAMYQTGPVNGIYVNPQSGQVNTGTINAVILDDAGKPIQQFSSYGTQTGQYYPSNRELNVVAKQTTYDESNNPVQVWYYKDGSQVTFNEKNQQVGYAPGYLPSSQNINTTPVNTRDLAAAGQPINPAAPQLYTDPRTGVTYTVGNSTSAQVTNALSGAVGATGGFLVGSTLNSQLNRTFLGKSVFGQTVSAVTSGIVGTYTARAINNGLQPILNNFTNTISQGWDKATGEIRTVWSSWTNNGRYDPNNPNNSNIVTQVSDGEGGYIITDKAGGVTFLDSNKKVTGSVPPTNEGFFSNWFNGSPGQNRDTVAVQPPYGTVWTDGSGNPILAGGGGYVSTEGGIDPNINNSAEGPSPYSDTQFG